MEGDIVEMILSLARRDVYNGVGRVLIGELEAHGFTRDQVTAAIKALKSKYRVMVVGDVIKIYFGENA